MKDNERTVVSESARTKCCGGMIFKDPGGVEYPCADCPEKPTVFAGYPDLTTPPNDKQDRDYIIAKLKQRVLAKHGGTADPWVHHTNLTEGDSVMHKEAAARLRTHPSATRDINAIHQFLGPNSGLTVRDVAAVLDAANKVRP